MFSRVDEAIFSEALRQAYPHATFVDQDLSPAVTFHPSIVDCSEHRMVGILAPEEEGWVPSVRPHPGGVRIFSHPERHLSFDRSEWDWGPEFIQAKWAWDPPTLSRGRITGGYWPEEKDQLAFIRATWRLIERVATNRVKKGHPLGNEMMCGDRLLMEDMKGGFTWAGHHALEWCTEQPRRMLDGRIRPCDDWKPPDDPWYRALREKVLAKYGPELGRAPAVRGRRDRW